MFFLTISHANVPGYLGSFCPFHTYTYHYIFFKNLYNKQINHYICSLTHFTPIPTTTFGLLYHCMPIPTTKFGLFVPFHTHTHHYVGAFVPFHTHTYHYIWAFVSLHAHTYHYIWAVVPFHMHTYHYICFLSITPASPPLHLSFLSISQANLPLYLSFLLFSQTNLPLYLCFFIHFTRKPTTIFGLFYPFYTCPLAQLRCHIGMGAVEGVCTVAMLVIGAALIAVNRLLGTCDKTNRTTN